MEVAVGMNAIAQKAHQTLQNVLEARIRGSKAGEDFAFNARALTALKEMHENVKRTPIEFLSPLPKRENLPDFLGDESKDLITLEKIKQVEFDQGTDNLVSTMVMLATIDVKCFFSVLQSQGFDLWLTQATTASYLPPPCFTNHRNDLISHLESVRTMVETTLCRESKLVVHLEPSALRVLCMLDVEKEESIGYFNDEGLEDNYPKIVGK